MARPPAPYSGRAVTHTGTALADENNATGIAFWAALAMIFVRMSVLPEILSYITGVNTYVLYIIGPPALLGVLFTGGVARVYRSKAAWYWTGFFVCALVAIPFSSWVGGSAQLLSTYARTNFICLLTLAGTVVRWKEIRRTFFFMALAGLVVLVVIRLLATPDAEGRLALDVQDSTIGNSNDLAAHVMLLMPFILYLGFKPGGKKLSRIFVSLGGLYSLWIILGTSSRGALIGLAVMAAFLFFKATGGQRIAVLAGIPIIAMLLLAILPEKNIARLKTLLSASPSNDSSGIAAEAGESMESRSYLLKKSIEYTISHPILGVGPGQFATFEGSASRLAGQHGNWHETHNTYTEISSECGLPALIFALAGIVSSFSIVNRTLKRARLLGNQEVAGACICYMTAWIGYLVTLLFLAGAYRFTLPTMISLGIAIGLAGASELNAAETQTHSGTMARPAAR